MRQFVFAAIIVGVCLIVLASTRLGGAVPGQAGSAAASSPTPTRPPPPPSNHPPVAHDGEGIAPSAATVLDISLEGHDVDFCGGGQSFYIRDVSLPAHGTLSNQDPLFCQDQPANGYALLTTTFDYTPNAGYVGDDTFTFGYDDGFAASNIATFTMHVQADGTPPATPTPTPTPTPTRRPHQLRLQLQLRLRSLP